MKGRRVPPDEKGWLPPLQPGDYGHADVPAYRGTRICWWIVRAPNGAECSLDPGVHKLAEHEDGTLTVGASILIEFGPVHFHGYLERGVWRDA